MSENIRWRAVLGALALFVAGSVIPLPGVSLPAYLGADPILSLLGAGAPVLPLFSFGVGTLVLFRGALALIAAEPGATSSRLERRAFLLFVAASLGHGAWVAGYLSGAELYDPLSGPAVQDPGLAFQVSTAITIAAANAVLWWISGTLSRSGLGHGPLILWGLGTAWSLLGQLVQGGAAFSRDLAGSWWEYVPLGPVVAASLVLIVLALSGGLHAPIRFFRGLYVSSALDLVILPLFLAGGVSQLLVAASGVYAMLTPEQIPLEVSAALRFEPLLVVAYAAIACVWPLQQARSRVDPALLITGVALVPLVSGLWLLSWLGSSPRSLDETLALALAPAVSVSLRSDTPGHEAHDADLFLTRLAAMGTPAELEAIEPGHIALRLDERHVPSVEAVSSAGRVELRPVAEDQELLPEDQAGYLIRSLCRDEGDTADCEVLVLEPPVITNQDIRRAAAGFDEGVRDYFVSVELVPRAAARFAELTAAMVQRRLAIVVDDRILSTPVIQGSISDGRVHITLGSSGAEARRTEAFALAAALGGGTLRSTWTVSYTPPAPPSAE